MSNYIKWNGLSDDGSDGDKKWKDANLTWGDYLLVSEVSKFIGGGSSQLLHNNNLKLATTSTGVEFGTGNDILIINAQTLYRNGSNGSGLHFTNAAIYPTDNSGTLNNGVIIYIN